MAVIKRGLLLFLLLLFFCIKVSAQTSFVVKQIRFEGLQRVSPATALTYIPLKPGQTFDPAQSGIIIQALYDTGFFSDVQLVRDGAVLIIRVTETPVIGLIQFHGNKKIKKKQFDEVLKQAGLVEGMVFDRAKLEAVQRALIREYNLLGHYNVVVNVHVITQARNRVSILIDINEGNTSKIQEITIIGNHSFSQRELLSNFQLTTYRPWAFLTASDHYSKEKLDQDLENLHNFYLDHGYLRFQVDSTQIHMSPDKSRVSIIIYITEVPVYHISQVSISGDLPNYQQQLEGLLFLHPGMVASRSAVTAQEQRLSVYLANRGYAFAVVQVFPDINDLTHTVTLNFHVVIGQRVYVHRISFTGNVTTADYVLRQEMRQMEGALYNFSQNEEAKRRLNNLGFIQVRNFTTSLVPGSPNLIDLHYDVKELSPGSFTLNGGYSDDNGFLFGAHLNDINFLGTGRAVGLSFDQSQYTRGYSFSYQNPYYTPEGISRSFSIYAQEVRPNLIDLSRYSQSIVGGSVSYGIPISEFDHLYLGLNYEHITISPSSNAPIEIIDFVNDHGRTFNQTAISGSWTHNSLDRVVFPTNGLLESLNGEVGLPTFGDTSLDYYKVSYNAAWYYPLVRGFIFHASGTLGYGNGYGKFENLPFFKNFYAGGIGSVRGYENSTLGPLDSNGDPIGGNVLTVGSVELIVPNPITERLRTSLFIDGGNVFQNSLSLGRIRYSTGVFFQMILPIFGGAIGVSIAHPINPDSNDRTKVLQFTFGTSL